VKARVYGLLLDFDQDVPWVPGLETPEPADVTVSLKAPPSTIRPDESRGEPWYVSTRRRPPGVPELVIRKYPGEIYWWRFFDGAEYLLDVAGRTAHAWWAPPLTLADALGYLFGQVLGVLLRLRGTVCLHGSAVAVGDRAYVLSGPEAAGKSTTAAALVRRGLRILTDDVIPIDERGGEILMQPGPPRLHLLRPSVEALWGAGDALPRISPNWNKHALDLVEEDRGGGRPLPLAAVYFLERRDPALSRPDVRSAAGAEALIRLVANTYANRLLDRTLRAREFEVLTRLADRVPIRRVVPPQGLHRLDDLCDALLADFHNLAPPGPAAGTDHVSTR
jgi:hypothetical protein